MRTAALKAFIGSVKLFEASFCARLNHGSPRRIVSNREKKRIDQASVIDFVNSRILFSFYQHFQTFEAARQNTAPVVKII
jgi:hypothetical protein